MPTIADIFSQEPYDLLNLTASLEKMPYTERRVGELGLFGAFDGLETDTVVIDEREGTLQILEDKPRGSDPQKAKTNPKAKSRAIRVPHMSFEKRIQASAIQGKRAFGMSELDTVAKKVNDKLQWMRGQVENTWEVMRLGAIMGQVVDGSGSVIVDLFDEFEVAQQTFDFDFADDTIDVREDLVNLTRLMEDTLGGGTGFNAVHILAGDEWFDDLISHDSVKKTFLNWQAAAELRGDTRKGFVYGGAFIENYRGFKNLAGGVGKIGDTEAYAIPMGADDVFTAHAAPGDFMETVNTLGIPMYAKVAPDTKYNKHVDILAETNPLFLNRRPDATIKLTKDQP